MQEMNKIRTMNLAFLFHDDDVLMIHRGAHKQIWPNKWSGVGGHVEAHEHDDLRSSVLREIQEETGLSADAIDDLLLRYIMIRERDGELRQLYVYFGKTRVREVNETEEGELRWVSRSDWLNLDLIPTNRKMLEHYLAHQEETCVFLGINMEDRDDAQWIRLIGK
ncbi:NUDIX domain-containing protein [Tumebacillus lipolyticus]|uniref:NUDIX domain-containing protein n=1 Tax=Tumebacillus lipolyticus TaxID=1280370 RepID=A0ABW4ZZL4_9BACL